MLNNSVPTTSTDLTTSFSVIKHCTRLFTFHYKIRTLIEHTFSYSLVGAKFKYLECFRGFLYLQALGDCEKKQSPNMSNPGRQVN